MLAGYEEPLGQVGRLGGASGNVGRQRMRDQVAHH